MTMVVGCHFSDGAVMIADSRVTCKVPLKDIHSDTAQKIIPLGKRLAIAFSGNVVIANEITSQIHKRIVKDTRLRIPRKLAFDFPRIARHYYQKYINQKDNEVSFMLGGIDKSGNPGIWIFDSPNFNPVSIDKGFAVIGSGVVVSGYLKANYMAIESSSESLKAKADKLMMGLESELAKHGIDSVGGLFQMILLSVNIRPLEYGFIELDPVGTAKAKEIKMQSGKWVQRDIAKGQDIELISPANITKSFIKEMHFHDYELPKLDKDNLHWHLGYFFTCIKVNRDVGALEFERVMSQIGAMNYPAKIMIVASIGFWGPSGDHKLEYILEVNGTEKMIHEEKVHIDMPLETEVDTLLEIEMPSPGPVFLECRVNNQLLARKALYFGILDKKLPVSENDHLIFADTVSKRLIEEHRQCADPIFRKEKVCIPEYFILCRETSCQGMSYKFTEEIGAVYWKSYPLNLKLTISSGFRFSKVKHDLRVDLVNAATREVKNVSTDTIEPSSECLVTRIDGELIVKITAQGIYFFNVYVDEKLITSTILPAETGKAKYSWSLTDEDARKVDLGELLILSKRSKQAK